ncbi:hypothetical protein [Ruegeria arenilitoris]|uniref:hypothetical protein n=1 Tax=Ruegeria arenilitoris TaxID=1173585 RepID=UPI001480FAB0|nr:hypothetical protein [Ruegeria arenilitoris]
MEASNGLEVEAPAHEMWRAVVSRAIFDLFSAIQMTSHPDEARVLRDEALRFLTATSGGWARSRYDICTMADINPHLLRSRVVAILEGADVPELDGRSSLSHIDEARAFWEALKGEDERAHAARAAITNNPKPKRAPKRQFPKMRYSERRAAIFDLLKEKGEAKFKDILLALDGDISDHGIREVLNKAINKGEITRNSVDFTYALAA